MKFKEGIVFFIFLCFLTFYVKAQSGKVLSYNPYGSNLNGFGPAIQKRLGLYGGVIGDIDNNGVLDLALRSFDVSSNDGNVIIMLLNKDLSVKSKSFIGQNLGGFPNIDVSNGFGVISPLGDLNNDGVPDIIIGDPINSKVYVTFLNKNGSVKALSSFSSSDVNLSGNAYFGSAIDTIGDLDLDGVVDVVIGANSDNDGGSQMGAIINICLNRDGTIKSYTKISKLTGGFKGKITNGYFGGNVTHLGDIDNDSIQDIAVTSQSNNPIGNEDVWIIFLKRNGTVKSYQKIDNDSGSLDFELYPFLDFRAPRFIGDIDNDGVPDITVGVSGDTVGNKSCGSLRILLLTNSGSVKKSIKIFSDTSSFYSLLGNGDLLTPLYGGFDFNGDYKFDLLASAPDNDIDENISGSNNGLVALIALDGSIHPIHPKSRFTAKDTTGLLTKIFTFNNTSSGYPKQVKWSFVPNTVTYQNSTTETSLDSIQVKFNAAGTYAVKLWVQNPFGEDSLLKTNHITVSPIGGFEERVNNPFTVYPIPATQELNISGSSALSGLVSLTIQNCIGEIITTQDRVFGNQSTEKIDVSILPQGLFFLTLRYNNTSYTLKFIK